MEDSKKPDYKEAFCLDCGFATRALHAGEHYGQPHTPSHTNPIYQSSTFVFKGLLISPFSYFFGTFPLFSTTPSKSVK